MALTYGFYNSINGDRKYNAEQLCSIFDGVIHDGVFTSIGDKLIVRPVTGMDIKVGSGRAWFDHTWTNNDSDYPLTVEPAELYLDRIDMVVLETSSRDDVRANSFKIVKGTPSSNPMKPIPVKDATTNQHPLAYIKVAVGTTNITETEIEGVVGTGECPFVAGVLESVNVDHLMTQWQKEFDDWFEHLHVELSGDVAANLQRQIDDTPKNSNKMVMDDIAIGIDGNKYADASLMSLLHTTIPFTHVQERCKTFPIVTSIGPHLNNNINRTDLDSTAASYIVAGPSVNFGSGIIVIPCRTHKTVGNTDQYAYYLVKAQIIDGAIEFLSKLTLRDYGPTTISLSVNAPTLSEYDRPVICCGTSKDGFYVVDKDLTLYSGVNPSGVPLRITGPGVACGDYIMYYSSSLLSRHKDDTTYTNKGAIRNPAGTSYTDVVWIGSKNGNALCIGMDGTTYGNDMYITMVDPTGSISHVSTELNRTSAILLCYDEDYAYVRVIGRDSSVGMNKEYNKLLKVNLSNGSSNWPEVKNSGFKEENSPNAIVCGYVYSTNRVYTLRSTSTSQAALDVWDLNELEYLGMDETIKSAHAAIENHGKAVRQYRDRFNNTIVLSTNGAYLIDEEYYLNYDGTSSGYTQVINLGSPVILGINTYFYETWPDGTTFYLSAKIKHNS